MLLDKKIKERKDVSGEERSSSNNNVMCCLSTGFGDVFRHDPLLPHQSNWPWIQIIDNSMVQLISVTNQNLI